MELVDKLLAILVGPDRSTANPSTPRRRVHGGRGARRLELCPQRRVHGNDRARHGPGDAAGKARAAEIKATDL